MSWTFLWILQNRLCFHAFCVDILCVSHPSIQLVFLLLACFCFSFWFCSMNFIVGEKSLICVHSTSMSFSSYPLLPISFSRTVLFISFFFPSLLSSLINFHLQNTMANDRAFGKFFFTFLFCLSVICVLFFFFKCHCLCHSDHLCLEARRNINVNMPSWIVLAMCSLPFAYLHIQAFIVIAFLLTYAIRNATQYSECWPMTK